MGHFVAAQSAASWPEVHPERLSPQLILLYSTAFKFFDHRNSMPGAGLYLVTEGQVTYTNRGLGAITAQVGDLVCLRPGFVETFSKNGFRVYATAYHAAASEPRGVPSLALHGMLPPVISIRAPQKLEEARQLYERMLESMLARRTAWRLEIFSALTDLIRLAFSLHPAGRSLSSGQHSAWSRWERLLSLIENDESLDNARLARTMNLGVRAFGRGFKERFGITPKQYLLRRRLWRAREALRAGKSVKTAAFEFKFSSPSHFSRLFKQVFGMSPSEPAALQHLTDAPLEAVFPAGPLYFFTPDHGSENFRP